MPETKDGGWLLDDSPTFTSQQLAEIRSLIADGKTAEAEKMIDEILKEKDATDAQ